MEDFSISMSNIQTPVLQRADSDSSEMDRRTSRVCLLRGRKAVAAKSGMLEELAQRSGQAGSMHWLEYRMAMPTTHEKIPTLLLVGLDSAVNLAEADVDDLQGAVLLYEYTLAGRGVRIFATDDTTGRGTVIASPNDRGKVAEAAARALLQAGALAVIISLEGKGEDRGSVWPVTESNGSCEMATRARTVPRDLPLAETHEATLANLGQHTRRNLRYYRRRLETDMGTVFVPSVEMSREEFFVINHASTNPVSEAMANWRYDTTHRTPGTLFAGVRAENGRWLSLIGGRRHLKVTEIDWQMNLAGLPRYSLSTVMRSYILQHEVGLGTRRLLFTGGTPHSIRHSYACVDAMDVIAVRRSPTAWLLRRLARWIFPEKNFLAEALVDESLRWSR